MFVDSTGQVRTKLSWTAPTENTDGTPIDYELAYNLYVGGEVVSSFPGSLNPDGKYEAELPDVAALANPGDYEFTLTAFDQAIPARESDPSNPLTLTRVAEPNAPLALAAA